uniref:PUM-HD domain-containing protein n=1 Tax=Leersia perrieri TaxID=77586 RepID=A0A0D9W2K7_9ORYZ
MAPFGDGGGGGEEEKKEGDARWGWDPMRSGSAPPTMEGAGAAAVAAEVVDGGFGGGGGGGSYFSPMDGLGARLDEVGRRRGPVAQEHFGNSVSLSNGAPGLHLNGKREFDGQQFGPTRVHSVGAMLNHSAVNVGSPWVETRTDDAEFHRHNQHRFMPNMEKMNAFARRDLQSTYFSDTDLSNALSRMNLSNHVEYDERSLAKELLYEMEMRKQNMHFSSKIANDSRSPLSGNAFCTPGSEHLDVHSLHKYGDGVLHRQNSIMDNPYITRSNNHHIKNVDRLSLSDLALMQLSNLHEENNYHNYADMVNLVNPLRSRRNTTDLELARSRNLFLEELSAQRCLQEDNIFLSKSGPSYNDNVYRDEPRAAYSRMQRSGSHLYSQLRGIPCHGDQQQRILSSRRSLGRNMGSQIYQDNPVASCLETPLDIANRNGAGSLELINVVGHVMEVSMDQYGSRFIQQKLEEASADDREKIFPEILANAIALTTDVFGNYVIQKFFEFATESQLSQLADQLRGHFLQLSFQMYGCRVVQKVIDVVDLERKISIVGELKNSVLRCISDQNGNHVIQKCIECVPEDHIPFVIEDILQKIFPLCTHQYGCRVIQRVLEHCHNPATQSAVMDEIVEQAFDLTEDKFGNYVVQHVLEHGKPEERSSIIRKFYGHVVSLSQQKYASNVVEKCLYFGTPEEREALIGEIVSSGQTFQGLMKDQFGNYVVQRVLQTCDDKFLGVILSSIRMHLNELKNYTFGKHIVARVEKLIITGVIGWPGGVDE